MTRKHIGMAAPPGGEVVVRGHVCAAMVETSGLGWLVVYSVYGHCGDDLGDDNWRLCGAIADHAIGHGLPWVAAGDWNFEPTVMRASGWPRRMGAVVLSAPVAATTHVGTKQGRHIDYFLAAKAVAALGPQLTICGEAAIRTHDAIRMRLPSAPRSFMIRRLVRPEVFPKELPIGPRELAPTPNDVIACARAARLTGSKQDAEAAAILIDDATEALVTHLENVLVNAYMIEECDRYKYVGRARGVRYAVGPLLGPKVGVHGSSAPTIRRIRLLQDRASALTAAIDRYVARMRARASDEPGPCGWLDVIERSRAAIRAGHHAAAASKEDKGAADVVCGAYGNELKQLGRQIEWGVGQMYYGGDSCPGRGRCESTTLHGGCDPCREGRVPPAHKHDDNLDDRWLCEMGAWAADIARRAAEAAEPCEAIHRNEKAAAVREWAHEASHAGAARAHRWTKLPVEWRPETVEADIDGTATVTADPGAVVEAERDKWNGYWNPPGEHTSTLDWGQVGELPRPTIAQFRNAARKIPRTTGIGVEGITPADFDALDDFGIEACIDIMMSCEAIGYIPRVMRLVLVRMIPKKDGGRRPIGLLPSLYRIWAKTRADEVRNWERKWERRYFAAGPSKSAEGAAWNAALRAEVAAAANAETVSVLWDLLKCFEHGRHGLLAEEARRVGFPLAIARMSVAMYRAERRLVIDDAVSEAINPTRGFMAGCARALALIKVVMVRRIDAFVARNPRIALDLYVDDVELQGVGTFRVVNTMADAVNDLRTVLCDDLGFPLAEDKSQVVASSKEIADAVVAATNGAAGCVAEQAVKLGVEMSAGKRRGTRGGYKRARFDKALARQRRLMKFKKMGGVAVKIAKRGIIPAATYGKRVGGVSNAELGQLRRLVAQTCAPSTRGASQALKLLLDGDPACEANVSTIGAWAVAAWECAAKPEESDDMVGDMVGIVNVASAERPQHSQGHMVAVSALEASRHLAADAMMEQRYDEEGTEPLAVGAVQAPRRDSGPDAPRSTADDRYRIGAMQLHAAIKFAKDDTADGSWEKVRGPASATVLTARRLGWAFRDGTTVINEYGEDIDMGRVAPESVKSAVVRATNKCTAAAAAERWGRSEFAKGIWVGPIKTALGKLQPAARAALRRAWTGGYWARADLADCGLAGSAECEHCGAARDDAFHRIWECDHTAEERDSMTTPQMRERAAAADRDDWESTRGLVPNPWSLAPHPRDDYEEVHVGPNSEVLDQPLIVDQAVFVDGSAWWPSNPDARRAGWSIVMVDSNGKLRGAIYGHLPWPESHEQTAGHAEMYALRRAAELAVGGLRAYTDYKEAAEGATKGRSATTGPRAKHAAHWRAFWTAVEGEQFEIIKVKGHVTEAEVRSDPELQWRRRGNALADRYAKIGAKLHYTPQHWSEAHSVDKRQEYHVQLCVWIGKALGAWQQERQCRRKKPDRDAMMERRSKRREAARLVGGHRLQWNRDGWQCKYCGTQAKTASGARRTLNHACPGHTAARIPRQSDHGAAAHVLWTAEADPSQRQSGADVTWCAICGAYSSTKLYKLRGLCTGPAEGAASTRLKSLQRLVHPVLGYRLMKPHRTTDEFMEAMCQRGEERRRMYDDAMRVQGANDDAQCGGMGHPVNPDPRTEPEGHGAVSDLRTVPPGPAAGNYGDDCDMGFDECDYDVFGHGGGLDATQGGGDATQLGTNAAASRSVPLGHEAGSGGGTRTVPSWLVAADMPMDVNTDADVSERHIEVAFDRKSDDFHGASEAGTDAQRSTDVYCNDGEDVQIFSGKAKRARTSDVGAPTHLPRGSIYVSLSGTDGGEGDEGCTVGAEAAHTMRTKPRARTSTTAAGCDGGRDGDNLMGGQTGGSSKRAKVEDHGTQDRACSWSEPSMQVEYGCQTMLRRGTGASADGSAPGAATSSAADEVSRKRSTEEPADGGTLRHLRAAERIAAVRARVLGRCAAERAPESADDSAGGTGAGAECGRRRRLRGKGPLER